MSTLRRPPLAAIGALALALGVTAGHAELVCATPPATQSDAPAAAPGGAPAGAAKPLATPPFHRPSPTGQVHALVLFADFAGGPDTPVPGFADSLFDAGRPGTPSHFYAAMSRGRFALGGQVLPRRLRSRSAASAYLSADPGSFGLYADFVYEVLDRVDAEVDFAPFDNDGPDGAPNSGDDDGFVDYLFVVVRTVPRGFIKGGATGVAGLGGQGAYLTRDAGIAGEPIRISPGPGAVSVCAEGSAAQLMGTMAHEFAHALGLPDLYDLSYVGGEDDSAGSGRWDAMGWGAHGWHGDDGPNEMSAWCLEQLGWIRPEDGTLVEVEADGPIRVRDLTQGGSVYRIALPPRSTSLGLAREYLLLEYRSRQRFYGRGLPAEGLLVWRVAPQAMNNETEANKQVDLVCADGVYADAGYPLGRAGDGRLGGDNLDFWAHDGAYSDGHGGNLGDATDPFDGVRFTALGMDSNPSVDAMGLMPDAASGPELRLRRDGDAMEVEVLLPRWTGTIDEPVSWAGRVLVDGDLRVGPTGGLTIQEGTVVLVAGGDRQAAGLEPGMTEIQVEGDLVIRSYRADPEAVVFRALHPGDRWFGLVMRPAPGSMISAPEGSYRIADAEHGIYFANAPTGPSDRLIQEVRLEDGETGRTAGNRDGQLSPGETVQVRVRLGNWSFVPRHGLRLVASWPPALAPAAVTLAASLRTAQFHLAPGAERVFDLPLLTVAADAAAGDTARIAVELVDEDGSRLEAHDLRLPVVGSYPRHQLDLDLPDESVRDGAVRIAAGQPVRLEARVRGEIASVDVVVTSRRTDEIAAIVPLQLLTGAPAAGAPAADGERRFGATWTLAADAYRLAARVADGRGHAAFSGAQLDAWSTPDLDAPGALIFVDAEYSREERERVGGALAGRALEVGRAPMVVAYEAGRSDFYAALVARHAAREGLVAWVGPKLPRAMGDVLGPYLDGGGRLLLLAQTRLSHPAFLAQVLHIGFVALRHSGAVVGLGPFAGIGYDAAHEVLTVLPPATAIALEASGSAAGLGLIAPDRRLVVLALDPRELTEGALDSVAAASLALLAGQAAGVEISVGGALGPGLSWLDAQGETRIEVVTGPAVERLDLNLRAAHGMVAGVGLAARRGADAGGRRVFEAVVTRADLEGIDNGRLLLSAVPYDAAGRRLAAVAAAAAFKLGGPADVVVAVDAGDAGDTGRVARALEAAGLRTAVVPAVSSQDVDLQELLLRRSAAMDATVLWIANLVPPNLPAVAGPFAEVGGRLVLATEMLNLGLRPEVRDFFDRLGLRPEATLSHGAIGGGPIAYPGPPVLAQHTALAVSPPAVVLLDDADDRPAAALTRLGRGQIAILGFSLHRILAGDPPLLTHLLGAIAKAGDAGDLAVAGGLQVGGVHLLRADRPFSVEAHLGAPADSAWAVLRQLGAAAPAAVVPMAGQGTAFAASLTPPGLDRFALSLRLARGGRVALGDTSVAVYALEPAEDQGVLLLLARDYRPGEAQALAADVAAQLSPLGQRLAVVQVPATDTQVADLLLDRFAGVGKAVIWFGHWLTPSGVARFSRFLDGGGHALFASLGLPATTGNTDFARQYLGVKAGWMANTHLTWADGGDARATVPLRSVSAAAPGVTLARDRGGTVVGARLELGAARVAYLGFDVDRLRQEDRRVALAEALAFLQVAPAAEALKLGWLEAPGAVVVAGPVALRLRLVNEGATPSAPVRVAYEVRASSAAADSAGVEVLPLAAGEERAIDLPPWTAREPGLYALAVRLERHGAVADSAIRLESRPIRVIAARRPFVAAGLPGTWQANGAGLFDADGDGDLDLYLTRMGAPNVYLRNDGPPPGGPPPGATFTESGAQAGLAHAGKGRSFACGDPDGDGDLDVYLVDEGANALLRNDGTGRFAPASGPGVQVLADAGSGRAAGFLDADGDGDLDLYLVNAGGANRLFVQSSSGWADETDRWGLAQDGDGRGLALADVDDDGDTDLYVANLDGGALLANSGAGFRQVTAAAGPPPVAGNVGALFADADGDGATDLFLASQSGDNRLLRGTPAGFAAAEGLDLGRRVVGAAFVDVDNDGDLDLATTALSPADGGEQIYESQAPDWVPVGRLRGLRAESSGRGLSAGDVDGDGDQDLLVADAQASTLYANDLEPGAAWLEVELAGPPPNRHGIGARVEVSASGHRQAGQVQSTFGYGSQRPAVLHFGLGAAAAVEVVEVRWPDGTRTAHPGPLPNQRLLLRHPGVATAVAGQGAGLPARFFLDEGYPNPFNGAVALRFGLERGGPARLEVYAVNGQRLQRLVAGPLAAGQHRRTWDGRDDAGRPVASGVYLVRLAAGRQVAQRRVVLLK